MDIGSAMIGGSVVSGLFGSSGASRTNRANREIARERNQFEAEQAILAREFSRSEAAGARMHSTLEARKNREFAERMSSSAVTRRMEDMRKAGINPILAGKFDASSPAGSMAQSFQGATAKANAHGYTAINELQPFLDNLSNALDLKRKFHEVNQAGNIEASTRPAAALGSELSKDVGSGYKATKKALTDAGTWIGETAAKTKIGIDKAIENASEAVKNSTKPLRIEINKWKNWPNLGDK